MKRKVVKKHHTKSSHTSSRKTPTTTYGRFIIISLSVILALIAGRFALNAASQVHVLGVATGPLLAQDTQDTQDTQDGQQAGPQNIQQPQTTPSQNQQDIPSATGQQAPSQSGTTQQPKDSTKVDCVGPNGVHFVTEFSNCQELNQKWGNQNFKFTPLVNQQTNPLQGDNHPQEGGVTHQTIQTAQGTLEVQTEGNKGEVNLQTPGLQVQMKKEDNGTIKLTAQTQDGKQITLEDNALNSINEALQEKDIHVSTGSANQLVIQSGNTKAETELPISLDPNTKTLAVTTSQGTKDLTVLPNQAVNTLLQQQVLSSVLASATTSTASSGAALNTAQLTEINNQPAYAVQGVLNKNLLGIFPIALTKTAYVSAQNGQVLQVQQSLIDQLLQAISF